MKKVLILVIVAFSILIIASSCMGINTCPTYANSSLKSYAPKYTYAHNSVAKKAKKNKIW